jgi:hypothetical protein
MNTNLLVYGKRVQLSVSFIRVTTLLEIALDMNTTHAMRETKMCKEKGTFIKNRNKCIAELTSELENFSDLTHSLLRNLNDQSLTT